MNCSITIPKYLLFLINFLLLLIGTALVAVGSWVTVDDESFIETVQLFSSYNAFELQIFQGTALLRYFAYAVIIIGSLSIVIALVGCCGVIGENRRLFQAFTTLMVILVVLEIAGAIAMGSTINLWTEDYEKTNNKRFIAQYRGTFGAFEIKDYELYSLNFDKLMITLDCCGLNNSKDFENTQSRWYVEGRNYSDGSSGDQIKIPPACCKYNSKEFLWMNDYDAFSSNLKDQNCVKTTVESNNNTGCLAAMRQKIQMNGLPYIAIPIGLFVLQVACIGLSILLIGKTKNFDVGYY
ncbi:hypothetical protein MN116_002880 [Schistosoma mekongi]|uniref:Tetraspanin n=1 Tax=Schistosoma mekongi TaxID=38744 RepID=A0AAE1ZHJ8_SCHME|nr:hypothetical protein MN116_002880 [Schistosoma mekongi]